MMDLFITTRSFCLHKMLMYGLEWRGYLWSYLWIISVFISCLDSHSDGTHSLQSIHWWCNATFLQIWWRNIHGCLNILNVCENALWCLMSILEIWRSRVKCLYLSSCHFPLRWCKAHLPKNGLPPPSKASLGTLHSFALSCWCSGESGCTNFPFPLQIFYWNTGWVPSTWRLTVLDRQDFMKEKKHSSEGSWSWCSFSFFISRTYFGIFSRRIATWAAQLVPLGESSSIYALL